MAMKIVALSCLAGGAAGFVVGAGPHALRPSGLPPALSTRALPARTRSRVCTVRMIGGENSKISKQPGLETGDGEEWIRSMELDPMDEPVDAAAWMAAESSDNYVPMEGDLVEYISDRESNGKPLLGMVVEDSEDKEVWVKALLTREGDGQYDEWQCFVSREEEVEEVPFENVRYIGTCSACVEVPVDVVGGGAGSR